MTALEKIPITDAIHKMTTSSMQQHARTNPFPLLRLDAELAKSGLWHVETDVDMKDKKEEQKQQQAFCNTLVIYQPSNESDGFGSGLDIICNTSIAAHLFHKWTKSSMSICWSFLHK